MSLQINSFKEAQGYLFKIVKDTNNPENHELITDDRYEQLYFRGNIYQLLGQIHKLQLNVSNLTQSEIAYLRNSINN